jgi:NADPH:quinone reductase-like Zn-dependent oxidoreductase
MLLVNVLSYSRDIYNGTRKYPFPTPLVIGTSGIGRIAATEPDTTAFTPGQLVLVDSFIRARDDPTAAMSFGVHEGHTERSKMLMRGEWKDATYAEYAKVPLENCAVLDEGRLSRVREEGGLGYKIEDLTDLSRLAIPYGGLSGIGLKAGETVIVAPATGPTQR